MGILELPIVPSEGQNPISLDEQLKSLKIDVLNNPAPSSRVGDSGYMSFQGLPCRGLVTPVNTLEQSSQIGDEIDLEVDSPTVKTGMEAVSPREKKMSFFGDGTDPFSTSFNLGLQTTVLQSNNVIDESMMSTVSSVWGDDRDLLNSPTTDNWEVPSTQILEQLSNTDSRGSHKSEIQLRYLLQLFMEASCLEWSLLISVLLRDAMAVLRTVNAAKSQDQSIESVSRLRQGLWFLSYWTNTECLGYKAFMLAIQNQMSVLARILETKIQHQQIIEYQQAVSATLNKVTAQKSRSRKSSQSQEASQSLPSVKSKKNLNSNSVNVTNSGKSCEGVNDVSDKQSDDSIDDSVIPESTGCVIS